MNTDASKFSFEQVEHLIRPEIQWLPFKRLGDYLHQENGGPQIYGIVWQLRFLESQTFIPGDINRDWKAIRFNIEQHVKFYNPENTGKPKSIRLRSIIMACPTNESFLWFLQVSEFTPEVPREISEYNFNGKSRLFRIDDRTLFEIVRPQLGFENKLWKGLAKWVRGSIESRNQINGRHHSLETSLISKL